MMIKNESILYDKSIFQTDIWNMSRRLQMIFNFGKYRKGNVLYLKDALPIIQDVLHDYHLRSVKICCSKNLYFLCELPNLLHEENFRRNINNMTQEVPIWIRHMRGCVYVRWIDASKIPTLIDMRDLRKTTLYEISQDVRRKNDYSSI